MHMRERIAFAIFTHFYGPAPADASLASAWQDELRDVWMNVSNQDSYFEIADCALKAMIVPTPKMINAAAKALSPGKRPTPKWVSNSHKHTIRYQAMIAAAASPEVRGT